MSITKGKVLMRNRLLKNFLLGLVGVVILAVAISIFTSTTAAPRFYYSVTDLGALDDYPLTTPWRINDSGQVIGYSSKNNGSDSSERAFFWQNGQMTDLGSLGGDVSKAWAINKSGQVVGVSLVPDANTPNSPGVYHAFLWENGQMTDLGASGSNDSSVATGINNLGHIVGYSYQRVSPLDPGSYGSVPQAVLWKNRRITNLGTLSGDTVSWSLNINNLGQIFGISAQSNPNSSNPPVIQNIFRWQNGVMTKLGDLASPSDTSNIFIFQINNRGQVIGAFRGADPATAFSWQNGTLTNLGTLFGGSTGTSTAHDINVAGTIVGYSSGGAEGARAFIYRNGKMRDLNNFLPLNSGWILDRAFGINNKGQIVGIGTFNRQIRGFLLTPVTVSN